MRRPFCATTAARESGNGPAAIGERHEAPRHHQHRGASRGCELRLAQRGSRVPERQDIGHRAENVPPQLQGILRNALVRPRCKREGNQHPAVRATGANREELAVPRLRHLLRHRNLRRPLGAHTAQFRPVAQRGGNHFQPFCRQRKRRKACLPPLPHPPAIGTHAVGLRVCILRLRGIHHGCRVRRQRAHL